jgi:hypothetical protein
MRQLQSYTGLPANPKDSGLSALAKKLRLKPDSVVAVLNSPPGYLELLAPGPATIVTEVKPDHAYDAVQLFVNDVDELRALSGGAVAALKPDGLLWVTHRKGAWKNDVLSEVFSASGYRPISFVKVDETWTAVRLKKG